MGSVVVLDAKIINDVFIAIWCHGTVMLLTFDDLFVKQRRCYSVRCFYAGLVMTSKATTGCNYYNTIISNRTSILSTNSNQMIGSHFSCKLLRCLLRCKNANFLCWIFGGAGGLSVPPRDLASFGWSFIASLWTSQWELWASRCVKGAISVSDPQVSLLGSLEHLESKQLSLTARMCIFGRGNDMFGLDRFFAICQPASWVWDYRSVVVECSWAMLSV